MAREDIKTAKRSLKLKGKILELEEIDQQRGDLEDEMELINDLLTKREEIDEAETFHLRLERRYIKAIRKEKKCPTCFAKPINKKVIDRIRKEIKI
jgi:hypothetical protein